MFIGKFTSFSRRYSRFLAIACLLAVAVPAGIAISTDFAQAASAGGGGGRGGGGGGGKGGGGSSGGGDDTRECASGACLVITECRGRECGPPPPPPSTCTGAACESVPQTHKVSYVQTVVGCKVKTCNISRNKMSCIMEKAADAKLCEKQS